MKTLDDYSKRDVADLAEEHLFGSRIKIPSHCAECGQWVNEAEADSDYTTQEGDGRIHCPDCGPGTRIVSVLRYHGMI